MTTTTVTFSSDHDDDPVARGLPSASGGFDDATFAAHLARDQRYLAEGRREVRSRRDLRARAFPRGISMRQLRRAAIGDEKLAFAAVQPTGDEWLDRAQDRRQQTLFCHAFIQIANRLAGRSLDSAWERNSDQGFGLVLARIADRLARAEVSRQGVLPLAASAGSGVPSAVELTGSVGSRAPGLVAA